MIKTAKYKGQMLIEIVVAVAIIGIVLIGISDLLTRSSRVGTFQKQRDEAFLILQDMLSDYRLERDADPEYFYDNAINQYLDPCVPGKVYRCEVTMDKMVDSVYISIRASWEDGNQTFDVSLSQSLSRDTK